MTLSTVALEHADIETAKHMLFSKAGVASRPEEAGPVCCWPICKPISIRNACSMLIGRGGYKHDFFFTFQARVASNSTFIAVAPKNLF